MPSSLSTTTPQTYAALVHHFTSLLTVTLHTLLSARDLYPASTFLTARAYNIPVRQSRHPGVCAWVSAAVAAVSAQLLKCTVAQVAFVIYEAEGNGRVLERWIWDVSRWPVVPGSELETRLVRDTTGGIGGPGEDTVAKTGGAAQHKDDPATSKHLVDMEEQFRALLSRLSHLPARLRPLPPNCTFTLAIELREPDLIISPAASFSDDGPYPPIGHPQPWIPAQPTLQKTVLERGNERYGGDIRRRVQAGNDIGGKKMVPVRSIEAGEMRFEMWIEEGAAKYEERSEGPSSSGGSGSINDRTDTGEKPASSSGFGGSIGISDEPSPLP